MKGRTAASLRLLGLLGLLGLWGCDADRLSPDADTALSLNVQIAAGFTSAADAGVVRIQGPASRTVNIQPGETRTIDGLPPGQYSVALEALLQGALEMFDETTVTVVAGQDRPANLMLQPFTPDDLTVPEQVLVDEPFTVQFGAVTGAESYQVDWDDDPGFSSPTSVQASSTSAEVTLGSAGTHFIRVRAQNRFGTEGIPTEAEAVTAVQALAITTTALPDGLAGTPYEEVLEAVGGDGTYAWTLLSGSLPPGIALGGDGTLAGTPTAGGDFAFTVQVASAGETAEADLSIHVARIPMAYAFARNSGAPSYTVEAEDGVNLSGGPIQVTRNGTGSYVVTFGGLGVGALGTSFTALVNTVASAPNPELGAPDPACRLGDALETAPVRVQVACEDPASGIAVDARYRILVVGNDVLTGQQAGFSLHNEVGATAAYTPDGSFAWNSNGAAQTVSPEVEVVTVGGEEVEVPLVRHSIGLNEPAQPTPFTVAISTVDFLNPAGQGRHACSLFAADPTEVNVVCVDRLANFDESDDQAHTVLQLQEGRAGAPWAYTFVTSEGPIPELTAASTGGVTVQQQATGKWRVTFDGLSLAATPAIAVTPVAAAWRYCSHFRVDSDPLVLDVACTDEGGSFVDERFLVLVLR